MEELLQQWNGERIVLHFDRRTGAQIIIAIDSTRLGPGTGGTRMKSYPDLTSALYDALRLSTGMTYKFAAADFPRGGAKAVIAIPPDLDPAERPRLLRRYGELIRDLGGRFQTGPDVGTSPADMDIISEAGDPYVFCRTPERGGTGDPGPYTALGVFCGQQAVCERLDGNPSLAGKRILVQGIGSVGRPLIEQLLEAKAEVLFSDVNETVIKHYRDDMRLPFVQPDAVSKTECDILAPCALGGTINPETIPLLRCRAVAGSANNQLATAEDADRLRERDILYAPDFVINAGGAIAATSMENMGWTLDAATDRIRSIHQVLLEIFEVAARQDINTHTAAIRVAERRLSEAG